MSEMHTIILLYILYTNVQTKYVPVDKKTTEIGPIYFNITEHLEFPHIKRVCTSRYSICNKGGSKVCTLRHIGEKAEYRDFDNPCYLFLENMCEHPGDEYYIAWAGSCAAYNEYRRSDPKFTTEIPFISTVVDSKVDNEYNKALRAGTTARTTNATKKRTTSKYIFSSIFPILTTFDDTICPLRCPHVYEPICLSVNRGSGIYYKFFTFINQCLSYQYYCAHSEEFAPPPGESAESVESSPLSRTFCAASRYINFARFAETSSSLGHYGWLVSPYKATHIMEPEQRLKYAAKYAKKHE